MLAPSDLMRSEELIDRETHHQVSEPLAAQARRADTMAAVAPRATVCGHLCSEKPEGLTQ